MYAISHQLKHNPLVTAKGNKAGFTLVEILSTVAIMAVLATLATFFVANYITWAKNTADQQTLATLNDALTRYKCQGGDVNALTAGKPIAHALAALQTSVDWAGQTHQFLQSGQTFPGRSISALGAGSSYRFTRYNTSQAEAGGSSPVIPPVAKNFQRVQYVHNYPGNSATLTTTAGNTLVVFLSASRSSTNNDSTVSIVSSAGNTFNLVSSFIFATAAGGYTSGTCCFVATNIIGGAETLTVNTFTNGSDNGITAIEYSGVTGVDVVGTDKNKTNMSATINTTSTDMFVGYWANEAGAGAFTSATLNPAGTAGSIVRHDTGHDDATYEWLNSGNGYAAGTYISDVIDASTYGGIIFLGLK